MDFITNMNFTQVNFNIIYSTIYSLFYELNHVFFNLGYNSFFTLSLSIATLVHSSCLSS